jgi:hypothetical protein
MPTFGRPLQSAGTGCVARCRPVGTQIDDIAWATDATGLLLVTDFTANATYVVKASFVPGTVYVSSPIDSGVASFIGTLDISTGIITPALLGLPDPSNIIFVP